MKSPPKINSAPPPINSSAQSFKKFTVIVDSKEKANIWNFPPSNCCKGCVIKNMLTGDYTIEGMQDIFSIERKASTGEFSGNITEPRFDRELQRLAKLPHAFLILEFTLEDVFNFPMGSKIPSKYWSKLRVSAGFILKRLVEIQTKYPTIQVIFAGDRGSDIAEVIFKRMNVLYNA